MKSKLIILALTATALVVFGPAVQAGDKEDDPMGGAPPVQTTVPDGGTTIMLLGGALTAVELLRRTLLKRSPTTRAARGPDGFPLEQEQMRRVSKLKR